MESVNSDLPAVDDVSDGINDTTTVVVTGNSCHDLKSIEDSIIISQYAERILNRVTELFNKQGKKR